MHQISSNLTLFLKFFIPVFWIVFFGAFTVTVIASQNPYFGNIPAFVFKLGIVTFYLLGLILLYMYLLRLKRVEVDDQFVYVSNYFRSYRYPWEDIDRLGKQDFIVLQFIHIRLKAPGSFGRTMTFLSSKRRTQEAAIANPAHFTDIYPVEAEPETE